MSQRVNAEAAMQMATDIVIAFLGKRAVEPGELPDLVRSVRRALTEGVEHQGDGDEAAAAFCNLGPQVQEEQGRGATAHLTAETSIHADYLISFEDGRPYRTLKRHLMARYGLTPEAYREKWGLPADYPMAAPNYAKSRSEVAKRTGLGRTRHPDAAPLDASARA